MEPASVLIFRTEAHAPGLYDTLFGGIFVREGTPEWVQLLLPVLLVITVFLGFLYCRSKKLSHEILFLLSLFLFFLGINYLVSEPWDELFVNLRHSLHLARKGSFSFNQFTKMEGIVDFLPYFALGGLAKFGFPLVEMALIHSLLGGILCLLAGRYLFKAIKLSSAWRVAGMVLLSIFPPLCFNSFQGFSTTLFSAAILWSISLLFFSPWRVLGFIVLSSVPLIRLEGGLFVILLWGMDQFIRQRLKGNPLMNNKRKIIAFLRPFGILILLLFPIALLSLYRFNQFGSAIPLPVQYKSAFGNFHYFKIGMRNFLRDAQASYLFLSCGILALSLWAVKSHNRVYVKVRDLSFIALALFLFVVPYYLSGGDWFPSHWGRYLLPHSLFAFLSGFIALYLAAQVLSGRRRKNYLVALTGLGIAILVPPSSFGLLKKCLHSPQAGRGSYRIQELSRVGIHFEKTTTEQDVIASGEVATIMYFAGREGLDLLGIVNPEIVSERLIENNNLAYRRRNPALVERHLPAIVWAYDYTTFISADDSDDAVRVELGRRMKRYQIENEFRFGGLSSLYRLGYQPIVVIYGNHFSTMYLVHRNHLSRHLERLSQLQFMSNSVSLKQNTQASDK